MPARPMPFLKGCPINCVQELKVSGKRLGNQPLQRLDLTQTLQHFTQLTALILSPNGGFAVTQQHVYAMAGLAALTSLQAQYTVPNVPVDVDLLEFTGLTGTSPHGAQCWQ